MPSRFNLDKNEKKTKLQRGNDKNCTIFLFIIQKTSISFVNNFISVFVKVFGAF